MTAGLAPRDPDAAEKARDTFASVLADLELTAVQRMAVKAAAEDFASRFVEAHARSPYKTRRQRQEEAKPA
jgi:hypothetical protein